MYLPNMVRNPCLYGWRDCPSISFSLQRRSKHLISFSYLKIRGKDLTKKACAKDVETLKAIVDALREKYLKRRFFDTSPSNHKDRDLIFLDFFS